MNKMIFIIEDDASIRADFTELLLAEGYVVRAFINGKEGLDGLRGCAEPPSLILLDIMMPIMNGYQFLSEIEPLTQYSLIPVLIMSADRSAVERIDQRKNISFMKKPVDLNIFLEKVATLTV